MPTTKEMTRAPTNEEIYNRIQTIRDTRMYIKDYTNGVVHPQTVYDILEFIFSPIDIKDDEKDTSE